MKPYQEEYIANVREFISVDFRPGPEDPTMEAYVQRLQAQRRRRAQLVERNMELLRNNLLPDLDSLSEASEEERRALQAFSTDLLGSPQAPKQVDVGLLCQIQEALLALARQEGNRSDIIEHLYWLGIGRFYLANTLVNMNKVADIYYDAIRECFQEVARYLEQFDEIEDDKTRAYIIRALGNRALGQFPTVGEKIRYLKAALEVMEDPHYRSIAPNLPWDKYVKATHLLMVGTMSHSREKAMTGKDVADIMRSVYIVYRGAARTPQREFDSSAIEFYCGIHGIDYFLQQLERQIDAADSRDFSPDGMYVMISLPAFYCQYLSQYPERVGERERYYVAGLYRRIQFYLDAVPSSQKGETLFLFLRQILCTFIELEHGIPYRDFLYRLILHFSPELYIHSRTIAELAKVLCGSLLDRDSAFFDEIPSIRDIPDPAEKRRALLDFAEGCGLFHDAGKVNNPEIHTRIARRWSPVEDSMIRLHTVTGYDMLLGRASTSRYAAAALGHHAWYDGNRVLGYPDAYRRDQCPERRMVDVIALAHWLAGKIEIDGQEGHAPADSVFRQAVYLGGRQFSPHVAALLEDETVCSALKQALKDAPERAYVEIYEASGKKSDEP